VIVFDLKCSADHVFEAWFSSSSSFDDQKRQGHLICPMCGDGDICKSVMAPNVAAKGNSKTSSDVANVVKPSLPDTPEVQKLIAAVAKLQAEALPKSEWVGRDFDRKARAIEAGDEAPAAIHGQATPEEARALIEDGISIMPLLVPIVPPKERN
jgi:hypothetical protein